MKWYQGMQESVNSRIHSLFVVLAQFISQFGSDGSMEEIFEWLCDIRLELVNERGSSGGGIPQAKSLAGRMYAKSAAEVLDTIYSSESL